MITHGGPVRITYVLDPPANAPDDWDRVEVVEEFSNFDLDQAVLMLGGAGAPTVVPKLRLDGYASWRTRSATIEVGGVRVAAVDAEGWDPSPLDVEQLLAVLGDTITTSGRLAWLMAHAAARSGAVPWLCDDCAGDDDCAYRAVVAIIGKLGR